MMILLTTFTLFFILMGIIDIYFNILVTLYINKSKYRKTMSDVTNFIWKALMIVSINYFTFLLLIQIYNQSDISLWTISQKQTLAALGGGLSVVYLLLKRK